MRNSTRLSRATPALRSTSRALHLNRAAHRIDDAPELDDRAIAGALDDAPVVRGDRGVDTAAQPPEAAPGSWSSSVPVSRE